MKICTFAAITILSSLVLSGCQTQSSSSSSQPPQPPSSSSSSSSPPSSPSSPSSSQQPPSSQSESSSSQSQSQSESQSQSQSESDSSESSDSSQQETAEESYGARSSSSDSSSEDIPEPVITAGASIEVLEEVLREMGELEEQIEAEINENSGEYTEEELEELEEMLEVLGEAEARLEADIESGQIGDYVVIFTPAELMEILAELEGMINEEIASGNHSAEEVAEMEGVLADMGNLEAAIEATIASNTPPTGGSEEVSVLDEALDASMGEFDGMILSERQAAQGKPGEFEDDTEMSGSAGDEEALFEDDEAGGAPAAPGSEGDGQQQGQAGAPGTPNGEQGEEGNRAHGMPTGKQTGHAQIPEDIPDGSDDDIVARQIREAAMNEPDPDLREKLWDEYRKYKNNGK